MLFWSVVFLGPRGPLVLPSIITSARSTNIAAEILIVSVVLRGTRVAPCCRWDTRQRGAAPRRGRDEQPSWTREQPVLPAEVVAPPLLSRGAAISVGGGAQIDRLTVKMAFFS